MSQVSSFFLVFHLSNHKIWRPIFIIKFPQISQPPRCPLSSRGRWVGRGVCRGVAGADDVSTCKTIELGIQMSPKRKPYFPLNSGCFIGIFCHGFWHKSPHNRVAYHPLQLYTLNNQGPRFFKLFTYLGWKLAIGEMWVNIPLHYMERNLELNGSFVLEIIN